MSERNYITCPDCHGKGSVEREVRVRGMNSGGFAYVDLECSRCEGEGEIEVDDSLPLEHPQLKSLVEIQSEREAQMEDAA